MKEEEEGIMKQGKTKREGIQEVVVAWNSLETSDYARSQGYSSDAMQPAICYLQSKEALWD